MYRREDQYRPAQDQSRSARMDRRRKIYRRRRRIAILTVLVGVVLGVGTQTGVSFSSLMPAGDVARGEAPSEEARETVSGTAGDPGGQTVLSAERSSTGSDPRPPEETEDARRDGAGEADEVPPGEPPQASTEPLNVLILGVDRRPSAAEGSSTRSDTMMLAQVTPGTGSVELLSVPRDLLVEVAPGVEDRINTAYAYGGVEQAKAAMERLTGIPIDSHAIIDFEGFEEVIDAVGGVKVDVGADEFPDKWKMGEGEQRLGGRKALFYARYRGTAGGDLDRIRRQQKLLSELRGKILAWNTVTKLPSVVKIANDNVDTDLGLLQTVSLGRSLATRGGREDLTSVQLRGYPDTLPSGAQVLVPDQAANEEILRDFRE